jgi:hypothetical protein
VRVEGVGDGEEEERGGRREVRGRTKQTLRCRNKKKKRRREDSAMERGGS